MTVRCVPPPLPPAPGLVSVALATRAPLPSCAAQFSASVSWHAAPVVSFVSEANIAVTAGWVTVSGLDFGFVDATPTAGLGMTSCVTSTWASATSTVCRAAPGNAPLSYVLVTTATIVGTQTWAFSYDGMRLVAWQLAAAGLRFYELSI